MLVFNENYGPEVLDDIRRLLYLLCVLAGWDGVGQGEWAALARFREDRMHHSEEQEA